MKKIHLKEESYVLSYLKMFGRISEIHSLDIMFIEHRQNKSKLCVSVSMSVLTHPPAFQAA